MADELEKIDVINEYGKRAVRARVIKPKTKSDWETLFNLGWTHARINGCAIYIGDLIDG